MALVYRRFGGSTHIRCDTFAQLKEAVFIPETQYVATSAPTSAFVVDPVFLRHLDGDDNGRIRVDELQGAVTWISERLKSDAGVDTRNETLTVSHLADNATMLKAAAAAVAAAVGADDDDVVTLAQVRAADAPLRARGENGDGIIAPEHVPEAQRDLAKTIMGQFPETKNRADVVGLAPDTMTAFKAARDALLAHLEKKADAFVWGEESLERAKRIDAVRARFDEHFLLCRLVASQPDARERFRLAADKIEALVGDRAAMERALASLPICTPDPAGVVSFQTLHRGPSFEVLTAFAADVVGPVVGNAEQLHEKEWRDLVAKADAILAWQQGFDESPVKGMVDSLAGMSDDTPSRPPRPPTWPAKTTSRPSLTSRSSSSFSARSSTLPTASWRCRMCIRIVARCMSAAGASLPVGATS
jgi:hypothetical protein